MFGKFFCGDLGLFAPLQAAAVTARQRIDRAVALMIRPHEIEPAFCRFCPSFDRFPPLR
jgi:hypothetical protein